MPLASRDVDFQNVSPTFVSRNLNGPMAPVACSLLKVRSVLEVVQTERTSEGRSVLHSVRLSRVTRAAERELFCRLMNVTGITLRVLWHAGLQASSRRPSGLSSSRGSHDPDGRSVLDQIEPALLGIRSPIPLSPAFCGRRCTSCFPAGC